jgi:predicted dehydrogenase
MATIRWGIIGVGDVTEVKSGPGFQKAQNSSLVAVMRRTGYLAEDYARRHHVPRWYDDAQALVNDPGVDAVYVATPPDSHRQYTLMAAEAGKPVYVEKPMALNFTECRDMIDACQRARVSLFVAFYRRALPRFLKVKALVDSGAIGDVRSVNIVLHKRPDPAQMKQDEVAWRVRPEISGGGNFVDLGSHMLDLLDDILGPIRLARGFAIHQGGHYAAEDNVAVSLEFESGVLGTGSWCFTAFEERDRTEIVGTQGKIVYATFADQPVEWITSGGVETFDIPHPTHVQQPLIQSVVDALNGEAECPSTGQSGARATWVIDQILAGYRKTGTVGR